MAIILQTAITYRPLMFFSAVAALMVLPAAAGLFLQLGGPDPAPVPFLIYIFFMMLGGIQEDTWLPQMY